ncbi:hypothetical protein GCM10009111_12330 [Colwellia asteriadis]|uniref:DUF3299 domain-containing protein n=1 Tax=Colwellia asteriadis TaxID=517723 RepID=A0ABN1L5G2_9GAMM
MEFNREAMKGVTVKIAILLIFILLSFYFFKGENKSITSDVTQPVIEEKQQQENESIFVSDIDSASKLKSDNEVDTATNTNPINPYNSSPNTQQYNTLEWIALIPEKELEALLNPPEYLEEISDGTLEDQLDNKLQGIKKSVPEDSYQQALVSTNIIEAMNGENIRIPGFVVPLEINKAQVITRFFLVPFFGACIHAPPPAPNQIIYVESEQGIIMESLYDAVWVSGKLATTLVENDMATAAYSMQMHFIEVYDQSY